METPEKITTKVQIPRSALLEERGETHGSFALNARISQGLKDVIKHYAHPSQLNSVQKESLDLICTKIGRILSGNADFEDHWDDIAGYAQLSSEEARKDNS